MKRSMPGGVSVPEHRHIEPKDLLDYLEKRADKATAARVRAHVNTGCHRCIEALAFWARTLEALQADRVAAPPEVVAQRAISLFDRFARKSPPRIRILAALVFDSRHQPMPAVARDAEGASFQL